MNAQTTASGNPDAPDVSRAPHVAHVPHVPHVIIPIPTYLLIFAALVLLTAVTVATAFVDLGPLNTVVAFTIAAAKALLVALYFMHLRFTSRVTRLFALLGVVWFLLLVVLVMADVDTRGWLPSRSP